MRATNTEAVPTSKISSRGWSRFSRSTIRPEFSRRALAEVSECPARLPLMRLSLASASPRRLDLLARIGVTPDEVVPADIDESVSSSELPRDHALRLAREKALAVAERYPEDIVLGADTVVAVGRRI